MKEIFQNLYNGILRFIPLKKYYQFKSPHKGIFPHVGFLSLDKIKLLEDKLGFNIQNVVLYEQAFIHRSYLQVLNDPAVLSNERLEFLGDSILGMVVSEYLFAMHPAESEGELTKMRSWLVNKKSLAICAVNLELDKFIMMSYSTEKALKGGSDGILADCLEALIAAVYLDIGIETTRNFIIKTLIPLLTTKQIFTDKNYKSILLEEVQSKGKHAPVYEVLEEIGPDHDKEFAVGVYVEGNLVAKGVGKSKKKAEQMAAKNALDAIHYKQV